MAIPDARVQAYTNLFKSQMGGGDIAVYQRLSRYQNGKGFGDFFLGLLRPILLMALNVGKSALSARSDVQEQGPSFPDTLKSALRPATKTAIHGALSQIDKAQQWSGGHRGRTHKTGYKGPKQSERHRLSTTFREANTHHPTCHHHPDHHHAGTGVGVETVRTLYLSN